jgi:hypothetical protein
MLILGQDLGKKNIVNIFKRSTMEIYSLQSQTRSLLIEIHSQKHFKFSFLSETIFPGQSKSLSQIVWLVGWILILEGSKRSLFYMKKS